LHTAIAEITQDAEPQILPDEAKARQGAEAEPPHPSVDSSPDGQHHKIQREEKALAQDPHRHLDHSISFLIQPQP